jgi:hypothetical protein
MTTQAKRTQAPALGPAAAVLSSDVFQCALAVFDDRRGQREGQEAEKVLCFHPTSAALPARIAIVGLAQALTGFTAYFTPVRVGCCGSAC